MSSPPRRITAVLSGGGAKAAAHLGAVRALREAGLAPTRYIGTSMGGVMAAALAAGLPPEAVLERAAGIRRRDVARLSAAGLVGGLFAGAMLQAEPLRRTLARLVPATTFADLVLPLTITTTDLDSGEIVSFGEGGEEAPLAEVLYAACALPVWYPPQELDGRRLGDGGLRGPLPLDAAARFDADLVVAVSAGPGFDAAPATGRLAPPPLIRSHNDATRILMAAITEQEVALWRARADRPPLLCVRPEGERGATFALGSMVRYERRGYEATRAALREAGLVGLPSRSRPLDPSQPAS